MQQKNRAASNFLERTDLLSKQMGLSLRNLAPAMDVSPATLFSCRKGTKPISRKTWGKLEHLEQPFRAADTNDQARPKLPDLTAADFDMETQVLDEIRVRLYQFKYNKAHDRKVLIDQIQTRLVEYSTYCENRLKPTEEP